MSAVRTYRLMLAVSVIANLTVGGVIFWWPDVFASVAGLPEAFPEAWPRHWGMQRWAINFLYLPGFWNPEENRWPNWMGIVIRFTFAALSVSQGDGFTPIGIYDGISGLLLLITYLPVTRTARLEA